MFCDAFQWHIPAPPQGDYFTVIVDLLRPTSQNGVVTLKSTNPLEQADININFFSNDLDILAMREGIRFVDDILMNGDGMKDIIEGVTHGPCLAPRTEAMDKLILERSQTGFRKSFDLVSPRSLFADAIVDPCGTARLSQEHRAEVLSIISSKFMASRISASSTPPSSPSFQIAVSRTPFYMIGEKVRSQQFCTSSTLNSFYSTFP